MNRHLCIVAAIAATMVAAPAAANVIFSDSFNRTTGAGDSNGFAVPGPTGGNDSDWGSNDNALGGTEVQSYTFDESRGGGAQQTANGSVAQFVAGGVQVELDLAPLAPVGYTVEFDFQRAQGIGGGFIAVAIGLDDTDQIENTGGFNANTFLFTNPANGAEGAVLLRQDNDNAGDGFIELFNDGAVVQGIPQAFPNNQDQHTALITVSAPSGYGAGAAGTLLVSIDGSPVGATAITFDGVSSGFLSFYNNQSGAGLDAANIDNLVVTAIPEPATIGLIAAAFGAAIRRRR